MPRFRATIRRVTVTTEVIEINSKYLSGAASTAQSYVDGYRSGRGIVIVRPHDQDTNDTQTDSVVSIKQL